MVKSDHEYMLSLARISIASCALGRSFYDSTAFNFVIEKNQTAVFRMIVFSLDAGVDELDREADSFAGDYK